MLLFFSTFVISCVYVVCFVRVEEKKVNNEIICTCAVSSLTVIAKKNSEKKDDEDREKRKKASGFNVYSEGNFISVF